MTQPVARSMRRLQAQRGVGALVVMLLLLFGASIIVFYLNRGLIFEQKASANQVRSTTAFEVAEAGIEWATGMLNTPYDISTSCALLSTTNMSFRSKYVGASGSAAAPVQRVYPGCKISGTTLTCSCPDVPGSASAEGIASTAQAGTGVLPGFTVAFRPLDATSVQVISTGCTAQAGMCKAATSTGSELAVGGVAGSAATTGNSDAWAQVSVVLKVRSLLRAAPSAALTCGTSCSLSGSYNVVNRDVASNGYTVNSGTGTSGCDASHCSTIPGQPWQNAVIANDSALYTLSSADPTCSGSSMFQTYLGTTMADYASSSQVMTIQSAACVPARSNCIQGDDRNVETAYQNGWRNYYFPNGVQLNNGSHITNDQLGAPGAGNGVNIVSATGFDINGNFTIYGLVFSNSSNVNDLGTGTANIYGAIVTCAGYQNNGNGLLTYDSNALGGTGLRPGPMVRVPGSWRDFTP